LGTKRISFCGRWTEVSGVPESKGISPNIKISVQKIKGYLLPLVYQI